MTKLVPHLALALAILLPRLVQAEPVAMATDVKGSVVLVGEKPAPVGMLHYFDAPAIVRLGPGATLTVTYFANPVQYAFKGPSVLAIETNAPKVTEGMPPETRRVGPERSIEGGLTKDQWRRLQQATVVMRSVRLAFGVVSPHQTTVLSPRIEFSWTPAAAAKSYRVTVSDENGATIATWTSASTNSPLPEATRLAGGKSYRWKVDAGDGAQPLSATGNFTTATPEVERRIAQMRPADASDVAANTYFATLLELEGFAYDAKLEWKRLARQYPDELAFQRRAAP